ncbi:transmembrane protein 18 isoform X2 [Bufo gargarizans]|uniref:transmembrane protein 18 isoform X2 n=1 Tax=Bufo gargarizans TaxID=30331 RepID=UPI001CF311CD|nr:transmembrane protein 18 isoform X2 [Bufo gargarizans]
MEKEAGVWELLERVPVDWSEPWIIGLLGFHLLCFILTCLSFKCYKLQIALFFLMVGLVSCAEYINEVAAVNWKLYSRQQYFDSSGMFISLAFSAPLLCNTIIIVVHWVYKTLSVMTELKTLQKKRKAAKDSKKEK